MSGGGMVMALGEKKKKKKKKEKGKAAWCEGYGLEVLRVIGLAMGMLGSSSECRKC